MKNSNNKKIFLLTAKNRKPYHLRNLQARYKEQFVYTDTLTNAEMVLCISKEQLDTAEKEQLLKAQEMNIPISYFTEELLPERVIDAELSKDQHEAFLKDELHFSGEELY